MRKEEMMVKDFKKAGGKKARKKLHSPKNKIMKIIHRS